VIQLRVFPRSVVSCPIVGFRGVRSQVEMTRKFNNCKGMQAWTDSARLAFGLSIPAWNGAFIESKEPLRPPGLLSGRLSGLAICRIAVSNPCCDALSLNYNLRLVTKKVCEICGWLKLVFNTTFLRGLKC